VGRGTLDRKAIKNDRDEVANRSSYLRFKDPGEYLVFIGPPQEGHNNVYVPCPKHFSLGKNGKGSAPCLNLEDNEILTDPRVLAHIEGGIDALHGGCAECEKKEAATTEPKRKPHRARQQFKMNMALVAKRPNADAEWSWVADPRLSIADVGSQLWDPLTKIVYEHGEGVCNPEGAMLVKITRVGTGQNDTKYSAEVDVATARKPHVFSPKFIAAMDAGLSPGGANDLFRAIAKDVKLPAKLRALSDKVENGESEEEEGAESQAGTAAKKASDKTPPCYQYEYAPGDDECGDCKFRGPCSKACNVPLGKKHRLQEGDLGYEEAVVPALDKSVAPTPAAAKVVSKLPETELKPPKVASKPAPAPAPADPEDDGEEEKNEIDYLIDSLGYTEDQCVKMSDEAFNTVLDHKYPASATSILPNGALTLFKDKLPVDHPEYEASAPVEPEPEPEKPRTARARRRAAADTPAAATPTESATTAEAVETVVSEPAATGTVNALDKLERDLLNKKANRKKPTSASAES
jgi:hypothetical protein